MKVRIDYDNYNDVMNSPYRSVEEDSTTLSIMNLSLWFSALYINNPNFSMSNQNERKQIVSHISEIT